MTLSGWHNKKNVFSGKIEYNATENEMVTLTFPWGIPKGQWFTALSKAATAKLKAVTDSGEDFSVVSLSRHQSKRGVSWEGSATAMQCKHHVAASRTETLGCGTMERILSRKPRRREQTKAYAYREDTFSHNAAKIMDNHLDIKYITFMKSQITMK